jgi:hypothetical protein
LPTEIIGFADTGDYLLEKQPYSLPNQNLFSDRERAEYLTRGVILMNFCEQPTIFDALIGKISPLAGTPLPGWGNLS